MSGPFSGYHDCPCGDCYCFEIAIGAEKDGSPSLCNQCEEAGCSSEYIVVEVVDDDDFDDDDFDDDDDADEE